MTSNNSLNNEQQSFLESVKLRRMIFPVLLGLGVVGWMMYRQLDFEELANINWTISILWWLLLAVGMYVLRHIFYAWRLMIMTDNAFSFWKSMQLIVIWEFSSAVSPTSVGGAGVALVLLAQEKLSGAKTVSVVLYSMVVDTLFFLISMPLLYLVLGPEMIRPNMTSMTDGYGVTFLTVIGAMALYGGLFFYGLFISPASTRRFLIILSKVPFLKRFRRGLVQTAMDIVSTSEEMQKQSWGFHAKAFIATSGAWITRFLALNFIIMALIPSTSAAFVDQLTIFARGEAMHTITSFSPTPGGAGIAEYLFGGFYSDYIPNGVATLVALVWRLITYYPYLILGAIVIPIWIRTVFARRNMES